MGHSAGGVVCRLEKTISVTSLRIGDGTNFSFADGHAEYWKWKDPRTIDLGNQIAGTDPRQPGNPDMLKVQKAVWGELGYTVSF
ncbi:MAG: hypothetical protein ACYTAS_08265 [Planctomycetota bacterium]